MSEKGTRVWVERDIKDAFTEYMLVHHLHNTERWKWLSVDEWDVLCDYHFGIFVRELKRQVPESHQARELGKEESESENDVTLAKIGLCDLSHDGKHQFFRCQVPASDSCVAIYHEVCRWCRWDKTKGAFMPPRIWGGYAEPQLYEEAKMRARGEHSDLCIGGDKGPCNCGAVERELERF